MEGTDASQKEAKHMTILGGLDRLIRARKELRELFDEIAGSVEDKLSELESSKVETKPTLLSVLNSIGKDITEEAETIIGITNEIRKQLF